MENTEKYYRRTYNAINKLIGAYKNGYDKSKTLEFRKQLIKASLTNGTTMQEEQLGLMFTATVALLGLNKESMERTGKFSSYKTNNNQTGIRSMDLPKDAKTRLDVFDSAKVISTDFDTWLSIIVKIDADTTNLDHLRRVRNGLLHSNFYLEQDPSGLNITHIKTKSYYEAEVLDVEFQMFVFEYFSNIEQLGLTENLNTFNIQKRKTETREDLINTLRDLTINKYSYDNLKTLASDTPELILKESTSDDCVIDTNAFTSKVNKSNNCDNFTLTQEKLDNNTIAHIFVFIEKKYGDKFYEFDVNTQTGIIATYLQYKINPKREISNWLMHFWYLYSTLYNGKFKEEFFDGDEFGQESCYSSLMILKAYLIMYRLQHQDFEEVDYSKVNFDVTDLKVKLTSDNINTPITHENYFKESFDKENAKGILSSNEIWNKIICEVLRNSLAHGNIKTYKDIHTLEDMVEIKDIDPKKGSVRIINMPLSMFDNLLNSEAFTPKNCLLKQKNATKKLTKN